MYPEVFEVCSECGGLAISHTEFCLQRAFYELKQALNRLMETGEAEFIAVEVIKNLPKIRDMLDTDIQAAYDGDPAARSIHEIMLAYPSFEAISIYRIPQPTQCWTPLRSSATAWLLTAEIPLSRKWTPISMLCARAISPHRLTKNWTMSTRTSPQVPGLLTTNWQKQRLKLR